MNPPRRPRDLAFGTGLALAAMTGLSFTLNHTAVPVVLDVPLGSLVSATVAAIALLTGVLQDSRRPTGVTRVRFGLGTAALLGVLIVAGLSAQERLLSYRSEEAWFSNNGVDLAGTLYMPRSRGPHPAVVFVHGSGPETRKEYAFFARLFARNNFAGLAYDKRGVGQSMGRLYESDYGDYAEDALAAVQYLRRSDDIDTGCIGLIGFSEGEWVAPLAASLSDAISFLIVIAPSGVSPAAQVNEEIAIRLRARGYSTADVASALALNERIFEYQRTGQAPDGLAEDLREASGKPWFRDAQDLPEELYPPDAYRWWRSVMDFQPGPIWEEVKIPVLLLKGGKDPNSTAEHAKREIEAALKSGGNYSVEFVLFPEGDHSLLRWPLGERVPPPVFASGYLQTMIRWAGEQQCARRGAAQRYAAHGASRRT
ncbi:MAG: alpha/beta hydrolase family protein [Vicinamibacteria bacterium]